MNTSQTNPLRESRLTLPGEANFAKTAPYLPMVAATTLLLHLAVGYRPFPSLDDFAYLPVFRLLADPTLYQSDDLLRSMTVHSLGWYWLFRLAEGTVGLALGFWLLTLGLSLATVDAAFRIARRIGASTAVLPVVALLAFAGSLHGIGRGAYDGAFGAGLHGQWLALSLLLYAYNALLKQNHLLAGALLGLTILAHFSVAIHGAFVIGLAMACTARPLSGPLCSTVTTAALVGAPALLSMVDHLLHQKSLVWSPERLIRDGFLFRLPHEYSADLGGTGNVGVVLLLLAGTAGILLLRQLQASAELSRMAALVVAHLLLLAASLIFYGPFSNLSVIPFMLSLTRTTPLLMVLMSICACVGMERFLERVLSTRPVSVPFQLVAAGSLFLAIVMNLRIFLEWNEWTLGLAALTGVLTCNRRWNREASAGKSKLLAAALWIATAAVLNASVHKDVLEAPPTPDAVELFAWIRKSTPLDALFIIPPGFEEFRWFAERAAYVDFKLFPPASLGSIPQWRLRLDEVASPDRRARSQSGWIAAREYDRCYATRNTPERIRELLDHTDAEYLVWDSNGLRIPPLTQPSRPPIDGLELNFHNERFSVYSLAPREER